MQQSDKQWVRFWICRLVLQDEGGLFSSNFQWLTAPARCRGLLTSIGWLGASLPLRSRFSLRELVVLSVFIAIKASALLTLCCAKWSSHGDTIKNTSDWDVFFGVSMPNSNLLFAISNLENLSVEELRELRRIISTKLELASSNVITAEEVDFLLEILKSPKN